MQWCVGFPNIVSYYSFPISLKKKKGFKPKEEDSSLKEEDSLKEKDSLKEEDSNKLKRGSTITEEDSNLLTYRISSHSLRTFVFSFG